MNETLLLLLILLAFYLACSISVALYSLAMINTTALVSNTSKSAKSRKIIADMNNESKLYLKLSPLWPVILCMILVRKIRG